MFFFSSRRRHTRCSRDWSSDVCSSDLRNDDDGAPYVGAREGFHGTGSGEPARKPWARSPGVKRNERGARISRQVMRLMTEVEAGSQTTSPPPASLLCGTMLASVSAPCGTF